MKLIFCTNCHDVVRLYQEERTCMCGESGGKYLDHVYAKIYGKAIPLGFDNRSFVRALKTRPEYGDGERFDAFVIPEVCPTIKLQ